MTVRESMTIGLKCIKHTDWAILRNGYRVTWSKGNTYKLERESVLYEKALDYYCGKDTQIVDNEAIYLSMKKALDMLCNAEALHN